MKFSALCTLGEGAKRGQRALFASLALAGLGMSIFGCEGSDNAGSRATNVLYTQTNEPAANTILGYSRSSNGSLTLLPGFPFDTRGTGLPNPMEDIGPLDSDNQFAISADHKILFSVNSGSNTIAVMNISKDGTLSHITGSPFASGGINPVSLQLLNGRLYVANKSVAGTVAPNYTVFSVGSDGTLAQVGGPVATSPIGSSAAQILASRDGKFMFTNDFLAPATPAPTGTLRSYTVAANGTLNQVGAALTIPVVAPAGTPAGAVPLYSITQGLRQHPTQNILYAAAPVSSSIGVYTYDATGQLTFNSFAQTTGLLSCWIVINSNASRMYVVSTGDNSVSVMNLSNPLAPVEIQRLALKDLGPTYSFAPFLPNVGSSTGSEEAIDPSGRYLYVVSHRNNPDPTFHGGNRLHVLSIASDGTVSEPGNSVDMNTSDAAHAQGMLVL